jgi:hypothetical protein
MVFSGQAAEGSAQAVRCRKDIVTFDDLSEEADRLWAAERNDKPDRSTSRDWGCVALLCNPDRNIPESLTDAWAGHVARRSSYGSMCHTSDEKTAVSGRGLLEHPWPALEPGGEPLPWDLLLATANEPTLCGEPRSYATPKTVATAWNNAVDKSRVKYFWNNVDSKISTFEDGELKDQIIRTA